MSLAVEVKNLHKFYGQIHALAGASFSVGMGEVFGLLGPNGAGKSSLIEILEGLKQPDEGSVKILGMNVSEHVDELRQTVGTVLQYSGYLPHLKVRELMELFASFYNRSADLRGLYERFNLGPLLNQCVTDLSGGQKQRFVLATALVHNPKLLFLDEPTIGLDPAVRQMFWDVIAGLRKTGMTIIITTHYMEEAQILCDRVGIIDRGKILVADRPTKLINSLGVVSKIKFMSSKPIRITDLEALPGIISARRDRYIYDLETEMPEKSLRMLLEWEGQFSGKIFNLQVSQATLEDVFLKLTGSQLRE